MSSLSAIRILKHLDDIPTDSSDLGERLRTGGTPVDAASLNRNLLRLRRHRWLTSKNSTWRLTPEGRKALKLALARLKDLAHLMRR